MSNQSNNHGRAFEYICLITLEKEISKFRKASIEINSSYDASLNAWNSIDAKLQRTLEKSSLAAVNKIFELEPLIKEDGNDELILKIQLDAEGENGDVRDILLIRRSIHWEIGLSVKHNHFAVKHSRISKGLDFGLKWFGIKCSKQYWENVNEVFSYLEKCKSKNMKWSEITDKDTKVYVPLLESFINEINSSYKKDSLLPQKMVEYLLGKYDFYKLISIDHKSVTQIQGFNLHGQLNKKSSSINPTINVPIVSLPTRIVKLEFKPNSTNTVELYMNNGWQFSFRIHNASTKVETSLKFDVQIVGMPANILIIDCPWR
ncbi:MAG: HaeIII family restriction endonuclease [Bacilli bacterium]|nr:HaeIII family restriction endonuclease [Bacilli bacterium]